ncbi:MAG: hypothetical protein KF684_08075 [Phycisphaeraceae bacterium]|nr:hypothetical protein [Phycisphaeraceae bacterium]
MENASLSSRIKAEFDSRAARQKQAAEDRTRQEKEHETRLAQFGKTCEDLKAVWGPRLDEFAKQFGDTISVTPKITPSLREAKVVFLTDLANMTLTMTVSANPDITKLILDYDLLIIPTFIEYDRHARIEMPLDKIDREALGKWIDDQLIACVKAYLSMQDNQHYLRWSMVEDPITKTRLLRNEAAGTVEHKGKTLYFSSVDSMDEYKQRHQITT